MTPRLARLARLGRFASVGMVGLVVNVVVQIALTEIAGIHYLAAAVLATQVSSTTNFVGSEWWAFRAQRPSGLVRRFLAFLALNNLAFVVRGPMIVGLTEWAGLFHGVSNLISLVVMTLIRFTIADRVIWRAPAEREISTAELAGIES